MAKTEAKVYSHFPDGQRRLSRMASHKHKDRNKSSILAALHAKLHGTLKSTLLITMYLACLTIFWRPKKLSVYYFQKAPTPFIQNNLPAISSKERGPTSMLSPMRI